MKRYLAKTRKRNGGLVCLRCQGRFNGRDAHDRHLVQYDKEDWCHLPGEVGLVLGHGGWWGLPKGTPRLDKSIRANGGVPGLAYRVQAA